MIFLLQRPGGAGRERIGGVQGDDGGEEVAAGRRACLIGCLDGKGGSSSQRVSIFHFL